jgi:hypothetical protein
MIIRLLKEKLKKLWSFDLTQTPKKEISRNYVYKIKQAIGAITSTVLTPKKRMVRRILRLYENKTKQRKIRKILFDIHFTHNSSHSRAPKFAALKPSYPFALPYWGLKGREKERERERERRQAKDTGIAALK